MHKDHIRIHIKRAYVEPESADGTRVLVDRLWPRGLSKKKAAIDQWLKDIAPSTALRRWFGHNPTRFCEFVRRYSMELDTNPEPLKQLKKMALHNTLTLVYAARDEEVNHAIVLANYIRDRLIHPTETDPT